MQHKTFIKTDEHGDRKKFWGPVSTVIFTALLYFGSQIIASFLLIVIFKLFSSTNSFEQWVEAGPWPQFLYVAYAHVFMLTGLWWLLKLKNQSFYNIGLKKPVWHDVGYALLTFLMYLVTLVITTAIAKLLIPALNIDQSQQLGFELTKNPLELLIIGVSLVIMPPIVEEIVARGFLFAGLRTKLSLWPATIITSIIFAVAHLQLGSGAPPLWVGAIDTFILSMFLVHLRVKTDSLAAPILLHMFKNGLAFTLLFIFGLR